MVRFDGYTATSPDLDPGACVGWLMSFGHGREVRQGRGQNHFAERLSVMGASGEVGSVQFGGERQRGRVMLEVKGEPTPAVVEALRGACEHRCTRVDACADFDAPGAFNRVLRRVREVKKAHALWGDKRGDWDDHPEKGRTQYLGAQTSPVRARLYEKGLQPQYSHLGLVNWVRLEIQVRPQKTAKEKFSKLSAIEVWGASKWSRDLAAAVLAEHVDPHPAGTVYQLSTQDRKLRWMLKQYGPALATLADDCGGWDVAGLTLKNMLDEMRADQAKGLG